MDGFIVSSLSEKSSLPFHQYSTFQWINQWTYWRSNIGKHIVLIKLWWGKRALASATRDISLLSHHASIFCNCKQFSLFLQVAYLGKLQSVSKFSDSAQVNVFVAINIVAFASTSINSNIKDLWDHSPPHKTFAFLINSIRDVLLGWKSLDWAKTIWTTLLSLCYMEDMFLYLLKYMKLL